MRTLAPLLAAVPLVFAAAACQVTTDKGNDTVEMSYNEDVAANAAADAQNVGQEVVNTAGNIAGDIGNDVDREAAKVDNKIADHDTNSATGNSN